MTEAQLRRRLEAEGKTPEEIEGIIGDWGDAMQDQERDQEDDAGGDD